MKSEGSVGGSIWSGEQGSISADYPTEERNFRGVFSKADDKTGSWRIDNYEDGKEYNGEADPTILAGIIIRQKTYSIYCIEILEEKTAEEKESTKLILKSIVPVD